MKKLYSLKNIHLEYNLAGGDQGDWIKIKALDNLSLDIYEGEYLAIVGANGSGKSSLGKLLAGLADNFSGELYYAGNIAIPYSRNLFKDVSMVLQEPQNQLLMPAVKKELSYPLENRGYPPDRIEEMVARQAQIFGLRGIMNSKPDELSGGQITTVALASAMIVDPGVIILDEPDSHFDADRKSALDKVIENYYRSKTVILITQYIDKAKSADKVVLLDNGRVAAEGEPGRILIDKDLLAGCGLSARYHENKPKIYPVKAENNNHRIAIGMSDVHYSYQSVTPALMNIDLQILDGQRTGIIGDMGSGKTTLGLVMAGFLKPSRGRIQIGDRDIQDYHEKELRKKITMSMQFPERALFETTLAADLSTGPKNLGLENIDSIIDGQMRQFGIGHLRNRHPFTLSGGEKRKAALAGVLAMDTRIIIFDEPTAALDPKSYSSFVDIITSLDDKTLIILSHDLDLVKYACTRIIELRQGRIVGDKIIK